MLSHDGSVLGATVGSYRIVSKLSEGGMGVVYRAQHALIGKPAAVKVLLPEFSANQEMVNRFFNEAKAATAIRHPGIVEIFDFGYLPSGLAFIIMEFLEGEPLARRMAARRLDEREALGLIRGMASALAAAHAQGIVHRDLKPDNVFLVPDPDMPTGERPKLLDFGIAKLSDLHRNEASARTRTGAVMGTPTYMSPEQCRGAGEIDHRSDLYALGCMLYEMVAGRPPFVAEGVGEIIGAHLFIAPDPPSRHVPGLSSGTEALIMRLLAKRPEDRVQSAAELARLLGQGSLPAVPSGGFAAPAPSVATGTAPGTSTTLSGAAAQATSPAAGPRSRAPIWIALVAVAGLGGVIGAVALGGRGRQEPAQGGVSPSNVEDLTPVAEPRPVAEEPAVAPAIDAGVAAQVAVDAAPAAAVVADAAPPIATPPTKVKDPPKKPRDRRPRDRKPREPTGPVIETDL